jgi:hypothetical protein
MEPVEIYNFINRSFWYEKYLPLEDISEYHLLREKLIYINENNIVESYEVRDNLVDYLNDLNNKLRIELEQELVQKNIKINILKNLYESNNEVQALYKKFIVFEADIIEDIYPSDDICLEEIEELYSRLITRLAYVSIKRNTQIPNNTMGNTSGNTVKNSSVNTGGDTYIVKEGDYFRKISAKPSIYNDERLWRLIYNANKNNRNLLPNLNNPDLILPGIEIFIPPLLER